MAGTERVGTSGERAPFRWLPIIVATLFTILAIALAWLAASPRGSTICPAVYPAPPTSTWLGFGRSVLAGVLQHVGAELSAHETIAVEQESSGMIGQLAAEYETIAAAAQRDRWAALVRASGLSAEQAAEVIESDAFGPLVAELRRAEANNHDLAVLLPRLVRARDFSDADDIAAVMRHRLTAATARPAGAGRNSRAPTLIAGLVPEAMGPVAGDMRQALDERRRLMEQRADSVLDDAITKGSDWIAQLEISHVGTAERSSRWKAARTIAAYRDRYGIKSPNVLGPLAESTAQRIDRARAEAALNVIISTNKDKSGEQSYRGVPKQSSAGRSL